MEAELGVAKVAMIQSEHVSAGQRSEAAKQDEILRRVDAELLTLKRDISLRDADLQVCYQCFCFQN